MKTALDFYHFIFFLAGIYLITLTAVTPYFSNKLTINKDELKNLSLPKVNNFLSAFIIFYFILQFSSCFIQ